MQTTDLEVMWKPCVTNHINVDIIFIVLSANIEITPLVINAFMLKNTQKMFLNVLGHMLLPVLASDERRITKTGIEVRFQP